MLRSLLLEELTILALGDDLHRAILGCRPVETMSGGFSDDGMP
jgi:hypothetical protein